MVAREDNILSRIKLGSDPTSVTPYLKHKGTQLIQKTKKTRLLSSASRELNNRPKKRCYSSAKTCMTESQVGGLLYPSRDYTIANEKSYNLTVDLCDHIHYEGHMHMLEVQFTLTVHYSPCFFI